MTVNTTMGRSQQAKTYLIVYQLLYMKPLIPFKQERVQKSATYTDTTPSLVKYT